MSRSGVSADPPDTIKLVNIQLYMGGRVGMNVSLETSAAEADASCQ